MPTCGASLSTAADMLGTSSALAPSCVWMRTIEAWNWRAAFTELTARPPSASATGMAISARFLAATAAPEPILPRPPLTVLAECPRLSSDERARPAGPETSSVAYSRKPTSFIGVSRVELEIEAHLIGLAHLPERGQARRHGVYPLGRDQRSEDRAPLGRFGF